MGLERWNSEPSKLDQETDRLAGLPIGSDAGLTREQAMDLIAEFRVLRGRLRIAEHQAAGFRGRLEEARLLPRR